MSPKKAYASFLLLIAISLVLFYFKYPGYLTGKPQKGGSSSPVSTDRQTLNTSAIKTEKATPSQGAAVPAPSILPSFPIDLNKATKKELMLLPGVGEKTAERIIEKRKELGRFTSVEELMEVKYIGPAKFEKMKGLVTVKK